MMNFELDAKIDSYRSFFFPLELLWGLVCVCVFFFLASGLGGIWDQVGKKVGLMEMWIEML